MSELNYQNPPRLSSCREYWARQKSRSFSRSQSRDVRGKTSRVVKSATGLLLEMLRFESFETMRRFSMVSPPLIPVHPKYVLTQRHGRHSSIPKKRQERCPRNE